MRLYIIRHGQTDWNKSRQLQGRSDIPLNENGRAAALATAKGMRDIPFDLVCTSPLIRARETARLVIGRRNIPVVEDERLAEISFGVLEGSCRFDKEGRDRIPQIFDFFYHPERYKPAKGGESLEDLLSRTAEFMRDICGRRELAEKTVLVSTHGAALRGLLSSLKKDFEKKDFWGDGVAKNCAVSIVDCADGIPVLVEEDRLFYRAGG